MLAILVIEDVTSGARRLRSGEDFAVNASHEILGPVAAIASAAQVLQDGAKDDPQARDRFITHISQASERLDLRRHGAARARARGVGTRRPRLELVPVRPVLEDVAGGTDDVDGRRVRRTPVSSPTPISSARPLTILVDNARAAFAARALA